MKLNPFKAWSERQAEKRQIEEANQTLWRQVLMLQKENEHLKANSFYQILLIMVLLAIVARLLRQILN